MRRKLPKEAFKNKRRGLTLTDLRVLLDEVEKLEKGSVYFEIGIADGFSLLNVAYSRPDIKCYGIEKKRKTVAEDIAKEYDIENVECIADTLAEDLCKEWDKKIDLLFIDGFHWFPNIFWDYVGWYPHVKNGGKIIFHDYDYRDKFDIRTAIKIFEGHPRYEVDIPRKRRIPSSIVIIAKNET